MAANPSSNFSPTLHKSPPVEPEARAAAVWAGLGQIFGRRFATEFGEKPSAYWVREVHGLADDQLRNGLTRLRRESRPHPPSLGEFVALCRNSDTPPKPHLTGLPSPQAADHWHGVLNLILLPKVMRAKGVSQATLAGLLAYKREVASTLRAAYGDSPKTEADQAALRDMEPGIQAGFDRIIRA